MNLTYQHIRNSQMHWKTAMKMKFKAFDTATAKSRKCHTYLAGRDHQRDFQIVLAVQEVRFFLFRFLIILHKTLCRKQPIELPVTEHIFGKIRPEFLKIEFLKGGTLLYCVCCINFCCIHRAGYKTLIP